MKDSQNKKVYEYIEQYGSITPMQALRELGVMRLASRISDLRSEGKNIKSELVTGTNRDGEKIKYARYTIEGGQK